VDEEDEGRGGGIESSRGFRGLAHILCATAGDYIVS